MFNNFFFQPFQFFICDHCLEIMPLEFLQQHNCCNGSIKKNQVPNLNSLTETSSKVLDGDSSSPQKSKGAKKNKKQCKRFGSKWFF